MNVKITGRILTLSQAVKRLNPELFVDGKLSHPIRKPDALQTLDGGTKVRITGKGRVALIVGIISFRGREIDDDNLVAGAKPLRDAIAETLQTDDGDKRIRWEYSQVETRGNEETIVKFSEVRA